MKPRYLQVSFGYNKGLPNGLRSKGGETKFLLDLEKWKTLDFPYSIVSPNCLKRKEMML